MSNCNCLVIKTQCEFCKMVFNSKFRNFNCIVHGGKTRIKYIPCPRCGN